MVKFFAMEVNKSRTGSSNNGIEAKGNRTATMEIPMLYNYTCNPFWVVATGDDGVQCQILE